VTDLLDQRRAAPSAADRFVIRRLDPAGDIARVVRMTNEIEAADDSGESITEEQLRSHLSAPGYDVARDGWVVEEPGNADRLIAEGATIHVNNTTRAYGHVVVHPAWRRQGLGRELMVRVAQRAREQGATYVFSQTDDHVPAGAEFLRGLGFTQVSTWVQMRAPADLALPRAELPPGYVVRSYDAIGDPVVLTEALNRGFTGHWETRERPLADIEHRLEGAHVRPDGIFVAYSADGDVAGVCWTSFDVEQNAQRGEQAGHIDSLGISPEHRRRGLGRALLLTGMRWLRAQGQGAIELEAVGNNDLALPLYYSTGYTVRRQGGEFRLYL
jgi:mycothiol synthase